SRKALQEGIHESNLLNEYGIPSRVLGESEMRELSPSLKPQIAGGIYYQEDAHVDPARLTRHLVKLAEKKGATLLPHTELLGFETSRGLVGAALTTRGRIRAAEAVLAAGAWSGRVAKELKLTLPIQAAKGYSVTLKRPNACPTVPLMLSEAKVGVTPMGETLRF